MLLELMCCIVYFVRFAVFFFDCSSSRLEKRTSEPRRTPAGWRAWPWHVMTICIFFSIFYYCGIHCLILPEAAWTKHILIIVLSIYGSSLLPGTVCVWAPLYPLYPSILACVPVDFSHWDNEIIWDMHRPKRFTHAWASGIGHWLIDSWEMSYL